MKKTALCLMILMSLSILPAAAEEQNPRDRLEEVQIMIEREQIINIELKAELAARESEISELKLKLRDIEDEIEALKREHDLT